MMSRRFQMVVFWFFSVLEGHAQWSTATLSVGRFNLTATTAGDKVLFAGGVGSVANPEDTFYNTVDIYNNTSGQWSTATLSAARSELASTTLGTKSFFGGGRNSGTYYNTVDVYNDGTGQWSTLSFSLARYALAAAASGHRVFFGGGMCQAGVTKVIDIYDDTSGQWSVDSLSEARANLTAAAVGTKILFAGGFTMTAPSDVVDIYDTQTKAWTKAHLSVGRAYIATAIVGSKVIFAGGRNYNVTPSEVANVDIYDSNTGLWTTATLSRGRSFIGAATLGQNVFFAGGYAPGEFTSTVDIYNNSTNTWTIDALPDVDSGPVGAAIGSLAFFGGGLNSQDQDNHVYVYSLVCPSITLTASPSTLICEGDSITLRASGVSSYSWNAANGLPALTGSTVVARPSTSTSYSSITYTVVGPDLGGGCVPTASVTIDVDNPGPPILSPDTVVCLGQSKTLHATGFNQYSWSPATGLSAQTGSTVVANPTATEVYQVKASDYYGCPSSGTITLTVNTPILPSLTADTVICPAGSVNLTVSGLSQPAWSPATGLSATSGSAVVAGPVNTTTYTVFGNDIHNCAVDGTVKVTISNPAMPTIDATVSNSGVLLTSSASSGNQWFKDAVSIPGAAGITFVATLIGSYTVQARDGNCLTPMSNPYNVTVVTGIGETVDGKAWVYPIPADDYINFNWSGFDPAAAVEVKIVDLTGRAQLTKQVYTTETSLGISSLSPGFYLIQGRQSEHVAQAKLVKQ